VLASDLDSLSRFLKNSFNYVTGPYQDTTSRPHQNAFLRGSITTLNEHNKFNLRYTLLNSTTDVLSQTRTRSVREPQDQSGCLELRELELRHSGKPALGRRRMELDAGNKSNNLILGYNTSNESRKNVDGPYFPEVEILQGGRSYTTFGFEPFTPKNKLFYHSYQLQDNFTFYLPKHSVTFGVSVEKYHSKNVFFQGAQSIYVFNSLADFYAAADSFLANPARTTSPVTMRLFQYRYSNISGRRSRSSRSMFCMLARTCRMNGSPVPIYTITGGLRVDFPKFKNTAYDNRVADTMTFRSATGAPIHYNSGALPGVNPLFSPRVGFNYDCGWAAQHPDSRRHRHIHRTSRVCVDLEPDREHGGPDRFHLGAQYHGLPFNPNPRCLQASRRIDQRRTGGAIHLALTDPNFKFRSSGAVISQSTRSCPGT